MKEKTIYILCCLTGITLLSSCSTVVRMNINDLRKQNAGVSLFLPTQTPRESDTYKYIVSKPDTDTLTMTGNDGRKYYLMRGTMDSTGTANLSEPLNEVVITAKFKNIAERNGSVRMAFNIHVPSTMLNPQWQVRLTPKAVLYEDTVSLEVLLLTGKQYKERQMRGYELYNRFLAGIITDTSLLMHTGLLETFIQRNIPRIAALRNDTALVDTDSIRGLYGISLEEAREHFMKTLAIQRNNIKKSQTDEKYRRFVKDPVITYGFRLDTLIGDNTEDFRYTYHQALGTRPGLRQIDVCLTGGIYYQGEKLYSIPPSEPVTFYVSSFATMTEDIQRYVTKVIERRVELNTRAAINFMAGRSDIDTGYMDNHAELQYIQSIISGLLSSGEYLADSLIITASCSPEGSYRFNSQLARKRAESIAGFIDGKDFRLIERHIPENWERLYDLIRKDSTVNDLTGILDICAETSHDKREHLLSAHPEYPYIKEHLYPVLREVEFQFCLHRKDMVKDTIHTTEPDTVYSAGVQAIKDRDYSKAVRLLGSYRDINSALAFLAMDYNASAMNILEDLPVSGKRDYLLAVAHSRNGNEKKAVEYFLSAVNQERSLRFRGNLDPEISRLIGKYDICAENL
ncbi:MAG TPA: hypothetical protein IAB96_07185 [Candidatus Coprenecus pullicola]|nr:hypothetical protein [Candidatus Coprenecus pullicola]